MSSYDRTSVLLLIVVAFVAVLIKVQGCGDGLAGSSPPPATQAVIGTVIVAGNSVNLREAATRSATVIAQAERGQELELLGSQEDWYNVRWGEGTAWLSKMYGSPTEDCPGQPGNSEAWRLRMPGEWKGKVQGRSATFVFFTRGEELCTFVLYDGVKEALAVTESGIGALTLTGKRYERLGGSTGDFWLDTFRGELDAEARRLSGTYTDSRNSRGSWFAERTGAVPAAALAPMDEGEEQLNTPQPEPTADTADLESASNPVDVQEAPASLASQPDEEPEEEPAVAAAPEEVTSTASSFLGLWEGEGKQFDSRQRWRLQMNLTSNTLGRTVGSIRYPSLRCGGELVLVEAEESTWTLREDITYGTGNCIDGGSIKMSTTRPDRAQWLWYFPHGGLGAQADIRRQDD